MIRPIFLIKNFHNEIPVYRLGSIHLSCYVQEVLASGALTCSQPCWVHWALCAQATPAVTSHLGHPSVRGLAQMPDA